MFGMGMIDNSLSSFINTYLGKEIRAKSAQFAAKNFLENITMAIILVFIFFFKISLN